MTPNETSLLTAFLGGNQIFPRYTGFSEKKPRSHRSRCFVIAGHKVRYHFDPTTSNANNTKRHTGRDFNGDIGVYGDRAEIMRQREADNQAAMRGI